MTTTEFYRATQAAINIEELQRIISDFELSNSEKINWVPFGGRENNPGTIEVSADPGRSLVERITNGIDALLEAEHERHSGIPECRSPREAASVWFGIPSTGLSGMTPTQRRSIAQRISIKVQAGEGKSSRIVEVRDYGIGLTPEQMPLTILSLNESNKLQKHYLAGTSGQGGSSTFAACKYTLIATRFHFHPTIGFTLVCYQDLPPDQYKNGRYVYLTFNNSVLEAADISIEEFPSGTSIKHYGYDLSNYSSSLGPGSLYGLLNQILFDPVLPVWLDDYEVHNYRRVIKGSCNALNGAVDDGDITNTGPTLSHNVPLFYTKLGDFGQLGIQYWVLEHPSKTNKRPSASFINPSKPIILTLNGQNQAELSQILIRKNSELPYLTQRLICHIDCNYLTHDARRALFTSNREDARRGVVYDLIQQEIVKVLKSDDELIRLNNEARDQGRSEKDETAIQQMRTEVARLLRLQGVNIAQGLGAQTASIGGREERPKPPRPPHPRPQALELHDPPTYIRIVWEENEDITFYQGQRRYIRIETDANSTYHDPNDAVATRINIISTNDSITFNGSTSLEGGRMRAIFECRSNAIMGHTGVIRVEMTRPNLPMLVDERPSRIVETPPAQQNRQHITLPPFEVVAVNGVEDSRWVGLNWPDNIDSIASSAELENGTLIIYYSTVFPKYLDQLSKIEQRDTSLADSFRKRYEIWLALHSLLFHQDQQEFELKDAQNQDEDIALSENRERAERCRIATLATIFAAREVKGEIDMTDPE